MAAQEIIELFSELVAVRLPIIEAQRLVPTSSLASVYFRASTVVNIEF